MSLMEERTDMTRPSHTTEQDSASKMGIPTPATTRYCFRARASSTQRPEAPGHERPPRCHRCHARGQTGDFTEVVAESR